MCSISGIVNYCLSEGEKTAAIRSMMQIMHHRGPDTEGYYVDPVVALGSTRLKIVGLTNGNQPIYNENRTIVMVCNGEILNYRQLREQLQSSGHIFATDTDVEVLLHLYEDNPHDFLSRVNGQFAFAIYDTRLGELVLGRDRAGICPLFYYEAEKCFYFASEMKALFLNVIPKQFCMNSLYESMSLWSVPPPNTVYQQVRQVSPGEMLRVRIGPNERVSVERQRYWSLQFSKVYQGNFEEAVEELRNTMLSSVQRSLTADVPVGLYLSGGVDSSILACIIAKQLGKKIDTFSIQFEDDSLNESHYQDMIVKETGSNHHAIICQNSDIARYYPEAVRHAETVLFRCAPVPLYLLSKSVQSHGFKAVLSGEGSDEIFWGYDTFRELAIRLFWNKVPESKMRPQLFQKIFPYYSQYRNPRYFQFIKAFYQKDLEKTEQAFYSHLPRWATNQALTNYLSGERMAELSISSFGERLEKSLPNDFFSWSHAERAQQLELITLLNGYLLSSQGDRMLMSHSVEGRFPFLDKELVELASSLHPKWKLNGLRDKYILREAFKDIIPQEIYKRSKFAYRAPDFKSFYDNDKLEEYIPEMMSEAYTRKVGVFDPAKVKLLHEKGVRRDFRNVTNADNMAVNTILSTHLLHHHFIYK
ncbi:asparagine synthase (glutamine-hydrolyzing) [Paenibacillus sp. S150]|uniref:asparagine synthase (glutamine-hydrolyzing) n=1 Tax=Paenibacillus sp. S150 TaxID=2749826 RepID=UPI001C58DF02|nr:asparagine synthase (glutamine-hydrolyzing) [Paenibacillus sp. S150]MBW4084442.1 asparagine synthase (glutamine-hydrolyzing) [Paenibacillus sp. S150]